jgi:1-acyl-sn-glycerol-3-phosphate acyltransferase
VKAQTHVLSPAGVEIFRKCLRAYFRVFHFTRVTGRENIPPSGPLLFAANHQSYYDPILIAAAQDLPVRFMAWDALFKWKFFGNFITDWGAFPVSVEGDDVAGFRSALEHLEMGERVLIFPEGGRSYDGKLMPLRAGVARLAIRKQVPVVPVRITGADNAWPRGDFSPRPFFRIDVHFCPPIFPRPAHGVQKRHAESQRLLTELEFALQGDSEPTTNSSH